MRRNSGPFSVALATYDVLPELSPDDRLLLPALAELGITAHPVPWSDASIRWERFDAVVIRSTWDYYERIEAFRAWLQRLESCGAKVLNPVAVLRNNLDKVYLKHLAQLGIQAVPTVWVEAAELTNVAATIEALPWSEVVIKPSISAGAYRTHRLSREALKAQPELLVEAAHAGTALIQPFLPEIVSEGEWSFLYFGNTFSHAVVKRAKAGDFRVQWRHGGTHQQEQPSDLMRQQVQQIFEKIPGERLYTRVDGVVHQGQFLVIEIEMIEPYLFLAEEPLAAKRFAAALARMLTDTP